MTGKTAQPAASEPSVIDPAQADRPAWSPEVDNGLKLNTNPFEKFDCSGNSPTGGAGVNPRMTIQDATVDTAPLQGSKDLSDDDHLGP